jgi:hypothetical protein
MPTPHLRGVLGMLGDQRVQAASTLDALRQACAGSHLPLLIYHHHVVVLLGPIDANQDHHFLQSGKPQEQRLGQAEGKVRRRPNGSVLWARHPTSPGALAFQPGGGRV